MELHKADWGGQEEGKGWVKKKKPKIGPASRVRRPSSSDEELTRNDQGWKFMSCSHGQEFGKQLQAGS